MNKVSKFLKTILSVVMSLRKVRLMSPRQMVLSAKKWWKTPRQGSLSNKAVYNLALRNLRNQPSRTAMTVTAIAMGTAAVVFLVSFAYGLQDIVTKRLVSPNSMRLTDVVSSTTSLALTDKTIDDIKKIDGVDDVAQMISLAGSLTLSDSRLDVVVLSVGQNYFNYASPSLVSGAWMSPEAFTKYTFPISPLILCIFAPSTNEVKWLCNNKSSFPTFLSFNLSSNSCLSINLALFNHLKTLLPFL